MDSPGHGRPFSYPQIITILTAYANQQIGSDDKFPNYIFLLMNKLRKDYVKYGVDICDLLQQ